MQEKSQFCDYSYLRFVAEVFTDLQRFDCIISGIIGFLIAHRLF